MKSPFQRIRKLVILGLLMIALGIIGYRFTADLSWLDALYMTVITLSTVGYREVGVMDNDAKLFTIFIIAVGAGVLVYTASTITEILLDDQTRAYFQIRNTNRRVKKMTGHFIVCGLGRVGLAVCEELAAEEVPFIIIETSPEKIQYASIRGWLTIMGDATEDRILEQAGIHKAAGLISCVDTDASNLFVVISAKGLNNKLKIAARVSDESNLRKFKRAGATQVYSPFSLLGRKIARSITRPRVVELLDLILEQNEYGFTIDECRLEQKSCLVGKSLKESDFRNRYGSVILSIIRENHEIIHNPNPDTRFQKGDILILLGPPEKLKLLRNDIC